MFFHRGIHISSRSDVEGDTIWIWAVKQSPTGFDLPGNGEYVWPESREREKQLGADEAGGSDNPDRSL
jgi:hypothetical protein